MLECYLKAAQSPIKTTPPTSGGLNPTFSVLATPLPSTLSNQPSSIYEPTQNTGSSSQPDGMHIFAPIDAGTSPATPGEHSTPICPQGQGLGDGMADRSNSSAGSGSGPIGHPNESTGGFQTPGGRSVAQTCGSGVCFGSFALISLLHRLASAFGVVRPNPNPVNRRRWLLRSSRFQRPTFIRSQGNHVTSRTAFHSRAPPRGQAAQSPER